jgi:hypothetical protein
MPMSAEECRATQRHASEWPNLWGRTITASAKLCVRLPSNGVDLRRTQRLVPPIGPCPRCVCYIIPEFSPIRARRRFETSQKRHSDFFKFIPRH